MLTHTQIDAAAHRMAGRIRRTPVLRLDAGEMGLPYPVTFKLELLQHSGSFKARGAFNAMLACDVPKSGVIAASGGNHGAAVAYAAQQLGIPAEIVVPETTPAAKQARIAAYGALLLCHGDSYAAARLACIERQGVTGALDIHAYDQAEVLAGQGTVGRELQQDAPELTHVLVAVGGGGLIGGIAAWYAGSAEVVGVEPMTCQALHVALSAGRPTPVSVSGIAADSLGAAQVGKLMFGIAQSHVSRVTLVTDEEIRSAQMLLWRTFRLATEPGGATALAALLSGRWTPPAAAHVGVVICGGNVDPATLA